MSTEIRTRVLPTTIGSTWYSGGVYTQSRSNGSETISTTVGQRDSDNPFALSRSIIEGATYDGMKGYRNPLYADGKFIGWSDWIWTETSVEMPYLIGPPPISSAKAFSDSDQGFSLTAFNRANPSRHEAKILASIVELRDLPKMLRLAGKVLLHDDIPRKLIRKAFGAFGHTPSDLTKKERELLGSRGLDFANQGLLSNAKALASANLAWQFGWAPIISDIKKLVGFTEAVDKRRREIDKLYSGKGLRRKVTLQSDSSSEHHIYDIGAWPTSFKNVMHSNVTKTRVWATLRFKPNSPSNLPPSDDDIARAIYGLDPHGIVSSAWELLPWSWLVDWFSTTGAILEQSSNSMGASCTSSCLMKHRRAELRLGGGINVFGDDGVSVRFVLHPGSAVAESKERIPFGFSLLPSVTLPILGSGQLSILGSLSTLRIGR